MYQKYYVNVKTGNPAQFSGVLVLKDEGASHQFKFSRHESMYRVVELNYAIMNI